MRENRVCYRVCVIGSVLLGILTFRSSPHQSRVGVITDHELCLHIGASLDEQESSV